jgi:hypothetical protein
MLGLDQPILPLRAFRLVPGEGCAPWCR